MQNITDNIYDEKNWRSNLPKPKHWPEWQPFPGDPSICPPDGYGPYALCHGGCGQRSGISQSACACVAEKTYIHALVEIVQMASWQVSSIEELEQWRASKRATTSGTSVVFIPYDFQSLPQYADSTYCIEWEPTPDFHPKTGHIVDNELRDGEPKWNTHRREIWKLDQVHQSQG
jgi:hypothetical protein